VTIFHEARHAEQISAAAFVTALANLVQNALAELAAGSLDRPDSGRGRQICLYFPDSVWVEVGDSSI
jgi:hypothetical protein